MNTITAAERLESLAKTRREQTALAVEGRMFTYGELLAILPKRAVRLREMPIIRGSGLRLVSLNRGIDAAIDTLAAVVYRVPAAFADAELPHTRVNRLVELIANSGEDDGYVLFTSGTTGEPKAVKFSYDTLDWRLTLLESCHHYEAKRLAHVQPFAFSAGLTLLAQSLLGREVHVFDPSKLPLRDLWSLFGERQIDYLHLPPTVGRLLSRYPSLDFLPLVRRLHMGGESVNFQLFRQLQTLIPPQSLFSHGLGFSEGFRPFDFSIPSSDVPESGQVPVGDPSFPELLKLSELDDGSLFEVMTTGPIAERYVGNHELTDRKFVVDGSRRWWKSGDLVEQGSDGNYFHRGRLDDLVKISGMLASPSEVQAALARLQDVTSSETLPEDLVGGRFVSHIELIQGSTLTVSKILDYLRQQLPPHAVPADIFLWQSLPTTTRGKPDRATLRGRVSEAKVG